MLTIDGVQVLVEEATISGYLTNTSYTLSSNGSNPYVINIDLGQNWTFEAEYLMNASNGGGLNTVFSYGSYTDGVLVRTLRSDGLWLKGTDGGNPDLFGSTTTNGAYVPVRITFTGTANGGKLEVFAYNGTSWVLKGSNQVTSGSLNPTNKSIWIGSAQHAPGEGFNGSVRNIRITVGSNTAPVATAGGTLAYSENGVAAAIDNTITLVDVDNTSLAGATVTISTGLTSGDLLGFTSQNGITGSYNSTSGILNLTGTATVALYQAALRSVTYSSTSDNPTTTSASRTISWQVNDGSALSAAVTSTINITAVNDAPTITSGYTYTLTTTDENTTSSATTASTILTAAGWADVDTSALSGLAITATTGNGTWQYSTDGTTWQAFGSVSTTSSLLLTSTSRVRYSPDSYNGETATITYKAWDQTTGSASTNATANYANTATSGGSSAFSTNTSSAQIIVSSINDAPALDTTPSPVLSPINEDTPAPSSGSTTNSTLISALVSGISDVDSSAQKGIAITAVNPANGTLYYSIDAGNTWNAVGTVSSTSALLLASDSNTRLYFQPAANFNGTIADVLTFRAWDQTSGTNGSKVDASTSGASTPFSSATDTVGVTVNAVNDAPVATGSATLSAVNEDTASPPGDTVSNLFTARFSDSTDTVSGGSSANSLLGVVLTANAAASTQGIWQWLNASTWTTIATSLTDSAGLFLTAATSLRFLPAANFNGTPGCLLYTSPSPRDS